MTKSAPTSNIDSFDRKILEIIQVSNRTTSDQIAEQVGLSPAAVQRRMKRMREQNIIKADIAVINPKAVGRGVTLLVQVTLERERADLLDAFKRNESEPSGTTVLLRHRQCRLHSGDYCGGHGRLRSLYPGSILRQPQHP